MTNKFLFAVMLLGHLAFHGMAQTHHRFEIRDGSFLYDGKPVMIRSGEMHYARIPQPYWRHRLRMMKAMGLNTVATYVFWNYHEKAPGVWDFKSEGHDLRAFVRTAAEEGLMVILRPGPYACAEWEFGGYPWWLEKNKDLVIRAYNRPFLDSCRTYIDHLADAVRDLQVTHHGPIIMVQVENEFASYIEQRSDIPFEEHHKYELAILDMVKKAGFDVPLYTADAAYIFNYAALPGVLPAANGETTIKNLRIAVDKNHDNKGPYFVSEFYPGWLDHWTEPFIHVATKDVVSQAKKFLDSAVSFNLYMVHGGTNFGFSSGANDSRQHDIEPDITSYDYDAPISEAGWATEKYMALRSLIAQYTAGPLPPVPARIPVIQLPEIRFDGAEDLLKVTSHLAPIIAERPLSFEDLDQGSGYVLYSRRFSQGARGRLQVKGLRDFAVVYVNGKKAGVLDRIDDRYEMDIDIPAGGLLQLLVENMGRINYGNNIIGNYKGIISDVQLDGRPVTGDWRMYKLPFDHPPRVAAHGLNIAPGRPVLYHASFDVLKTGDTFLDMSGWGKGIVFVNGHPLGRYWRRGPQQTLYLPGCWLRKGKNEVVVFEQLNDHPQTGLTTVRKPVLDVLNDASTALNDASTVQAAKEPADEVDNRIGVLDSSSNCVIGPQLPWGSINPSPQTPYGNDDGYSPSQPILGFGQLQVSGTGWGTNGQLLISPQIGLAVGEAGHYSSKSGELARPYEYRVTLDRYAIAAAVTPARHAALYSLSFPHSDSATIALDITHNIPMDIKPVIKGEVSAGVVHFDDDVGATFSGYGVYEGGFGGGKYTVYFAAAVSKAPRRCGSWINGRIGWNVRSQALQAKNDRVGAFLRYSTDKNETIFLKIAVSYKSIEQARYWLLKEIPGWDYEGLRSKAKAEWNRELGKIELTGGSEKARTLFYTALYHAELMPRDRTGDNYRFGSGEAVWDDHFAIWDTWRTVYPLHVLIDPGVVTGTINSFITRFKTDGVVKDAFVNGNEMNNEQGGNNVDNVIADAFVKHVPGIDWKQAYRILKYDADHQRLGSYAWSRADSAISFYKDRGWIGAGTMSCSMTLEYAYNDFCAAEVAQGLGYGADYRKYSRRSTRWVQLWNPAATSEGFCGFIAPRKADGAFVEIDPAFSPFSWGNYFYEGSSWDYSWFAPHQLGRLVALNGGKEAFARKLNYGLAHQLIRYDNEPSFLTPFEFFSADRPDLADYWVRRLMSEGFTSEGYPGNDDSGAMSSWFVFASMGFFPNAGQNFYYLLGTSFPRVKIHLGNGKLLTINGHNASEKNIYLSRIMVNGRPWRGHTISHDLLSNGGIIDFYMTATPSVRG